MAAMGLRNGSLLQLEDSSQDFKLQMRIVATYVVAHVPSRSRARMP